MSDNEGFFFSGVHGGGAPKDRTDGPEYVKKLRRKIGHELDQLIKKEPVSALYIFEPEHLKGRVEKEIMQHHGLTVHNVRYGNFIHAQPKELIDMIVGFVEQHTVDLNTHHYQKDFAKF